MTYEKLKLVSPFDVNVHTTVINNELQNENLSIEKVRGAFEIAAHQYGSKHSGLILK